MPVVESLVGKMLTCAETGKQFIGATIGCTTNYARDSEGRIFSDEGVHACEVRLLLDHTKPFCGYLSSDAKHLTGWKGNVLGTVIRSSKVKLTRLSYTHGKTMLAVTVRDTHGKLWHGRGNAGLAIALRASKTA